ncbi:hypothetical protein H9L21_13830 [Aeromicrobium senzhongii]|uniref:Uncharacterized protein n=1 Tax=Aeromicrobium senzhongii TaxID=2663859 RepID=A0ABX6SSW2_9ACTN|nr:hypothetical protein [Aeromicrobium senzhongii]MTB88539.1 hypothetical protein [Aeromicrobium senzhongii]QNL94146.1 hypothetical protein H9L21_13830 [Aeromicrobium senzhongii]
MLIHVRRAIVAIAVGALAFAGALVAMSSSATAAAPTCVPPAVVKWVGVSQYVCVIPADEPSPGATTPGGEDSSGPGAPSCDLAAAPAPSGLVAEHLLEGPYCLGTRFCVTTDLIVPLALPDGEPPNEDSEERYRWCSTGGAYQLESSWWTGENEPPSLLERALSAIGQIDLATPTLSTSPTGRTLVTLDTWFWASGASTSATGSAFDLVATATFASMSVDPGDGSGAFSCPLTTTRAAAESDCRHAYRRASLGGSTSVEGRPAYSASVRLVYDLSFTVGGTPVVVPGAPTTLEAPVASAPIRVDEVQSIVTEVD